MLCSQLTFFAFSLHRIHTRGLAFKLVTVNFQQSAIYILLFGGCDAVFLVERYRRFGETFFLSSEGKRETGSEDVT